MKDKKPATQPVKKPVDKAFKDKIIAIVEDLTLQAESRERVTELVNEMFGEYGVSKSAIRKVARAIYAENIEKLEDESKEVEEILENFTS